MKPIITGELNQKIDICSRVTGLPNGYGGAVDTFPSYWPTWAKAEPLKSSRTLEANQAQLKMVVRFTVRARTDKNIYNDMIVKWRDQVLIIQNYIPDPTYQEFIVFDAAMANAGIIMKANSTT